MLSQEKDKEDEYRAPPDKQPKQPKQSSRKTKWKKHWDKYSLIYIFFVPIMIHFLIFQVFPFAFSFVLTFMDWKIIGDSTFVGFEHWARFFQDDLAHLAIWNTVVFSIYYIIPTMGLGLILALIINSGIRFAGFFKGIFFLPVVTSFVIVAGIWGWMFQGTADGLINMMLGWFGIEQQLFLSDSDQALAVLAGLSILKVSGSTMIYYFAGLQSIPGQLYEAAKIDGANAFRMFWQITFPLLKPIHFYVLIITTISSFQIFDSAFLLTGGGPNNSTTTIVYYLYEQGFTSLNLSYAAVLSYVLFAIVLVISLIQRKFLGKDDNIY